MNTDIPLSPPSSSTLNVGGNLQDFTEGITPAEIEVIEARSGRLFSDVASTMEKCLKESKGIPFWALSFMLFGMALREKPDLTFEEFQSSALEDSSGRDIRETLGG